MIAAQPSAAALFSPADDTIDEAPRDREPARFDPLDQAEDEARERDAAGPSRW